MGLLRGLLVSLVAIFASASSGVAYQGMTHDFVIRWSVEPGRRKIDVHIR